ncbi:MAG: hypothetical protein UX61_C0024G0004 [Parcubacteria group bacterium GW2011_GWA2_46_7]|nr:MAG: hypothetical protein UX15_C0040G0009 [Parcubacteria group bacterium GW2011_GWA1_45_7]KKU10727.1 MAG: hypothetical protein UX14_C0010G0010 [Parcubacteria group bacterium GW2011_GWF1_45_5]KKU43300.1 MAG: hypothetical protein UX61_C0024G0004 [Parcubacteria group bacterium GW2011_GWA2_46_7]KKU46938.1 MAG: hypothetical protein UX66_C0029G0005 [Parcubacteria group bacterium GW2011_GWF2_46_8]OHD12198.1 MAG: hypothetical protein A2Z96_03560 [Spirochaetes bacterium GWB1_48_6]
MPDVPVLHVGQDLSRSTLDAIEAALVKAIAKHASCPPDWVHVIFTSDVRRPVETKNLSIQIFTGLVRDPVQVKALKEGVEAAVRVVLAREGISPRVEAMIFRPADTGIPLDRPGDPAALHGEKKKKS